MKKIIKNILHSMGLQIQKYKKPKYDWISKHRIKTVLDIGANTGQFAKFVLDLIPEANIYSFEPIPECFKKLNLISNEKKFKTYNFALGNSNYRTELNVSKHSPSSSILIMEDLHKEIFKDTETAFKIKIDVKRLDDAISDLELKENILIKFDVQGFEKKVIDGGLDIIARSKLVIIETNFSNLYKEQPTFDEIYSILKEMGYEFQGNWHQTINPTNGGILYADSVFVNETL